MENLHVTWETLLAIAGGVVLLMNAGKAIVQLFDPFKELKKKQVGVGKISSNQSGANFFDIALAGAL